MISTRQQNLVRESFDRVRCDQERTGAIFYERLFALAPGVAALFEGTPLATQAGRLMHIIAYIVDHLDQWSALAATIEALGARHVAYRVQSDHYALVGAALISTLHAALGAHFPVETEEAWTELYSHISLLMEKGARGVV